MGSAYIHEEEEDRVVWCRLRLRVTYWSFQSILFRLNILSFLSCSDREGRTISRSAACIPTPRRANRPTRCDALLKICLYTTLAPRQSVSGYWWVWESVHFLLRRLDFHFRRREVFHSPSSVRAKGACRIRTCPESIPLSTFANMVQLFYYESRGKCAHKIIKHEGCQTKVLPLPLWGMGSAGLAFILGS